MARRIEPAGNSVREERLLDIMTSPWALMPQKLLEIRHIYETHLRGDKIDVKAVEAQLGRPLVNEPRPYQVLDGGIAVIPLVGVLAKRANLFMQVSGGTSTRMVANWLAQAGNDPQVKSVILEVDSPGGEANGVMELVQMVGNVRDAGKPVVAWISGFACSGAYWIASAAERVLINDSIATVGSIGVVATHIDVSRREEQLGIKTSEVTAGKYKRIASSYAPLTEEGRQSIQDMVDAMYSAFVESVAENRGRTVDDVLNRMADGRVFIGPDAIEAGLVDGASTYQALVDELRSRPGAGRSSSTKPGAQMNREQVKADHPQTYEAIRKEGYDAGLQDGNKEGAAAERARHAAIDKARVAGHEALTAQAKAEGWDAGRYALAVLDAETQQRQAALDAQHKDAPPPLKDAPAPESGNTIKRAAFNALSPAEQAAKARTGCRIVD